MTAELLPHVAVYGLDDPASPEVRIECTCHACGRLVSVRVVDVRFTQPTQQEALEMAAIDAAAWTAHLRDRHPDLTEVTDGGK